MDDKSSIKLKCLAKQDETGSGIIIIRTVLVKEVMTTKVHLLRPETPFGEIVEFLVQHQISGAPVVDANTQLVGIVSEKDLFPPLFPNLKDFYQDLDYYLNRSNWQKESSKVIGLAAKDLMRTKVITIEPRAHVLKACSIMCARNIRRLPVLKNGKILGIVTTNDVYRNFLHTLV